MVIKGAITIVIFIAIILLILGISFLKNKRMTSKQTKNVAISYISVYKDGKFGVINSKGEDVIKSEYDNVLLIPDPTEDVFLYMEDVDLTNKTYKSGAINKYNKKIYTDYDRVDALQSVDSNGNVIYSNKILKVYKNGKYGLINFNGTSLVDLIYDDIQCLKETTNVLITIKDGKKGLIDSSGNIIIENKFVDIQMLTNNYENGFIVKDDSGKFGVITFAKKQALECKYLDIKHVFGNDFYAQEFDADKVQVFEERYPGAFHDLEEFKKVVGEIDDISFLGDAIYSKWRYVTHWETETNLLTEKNHDWLVLALSQLENLTRE